MNKPPSPLRPRRALRRLYRLQPVAAVVTLVAAALMLLQVFSPSVGSTEAAARVLVATSMSAGVSSANNVLGYQLVLPDGYRRSASILVTSGVALLGRDTYTTLAEAQERSFCLVDHNGTPSSDAAANLDVEVYRSSGSTTAADWARTAPQRSRRETVEAVTIGGLDAARFIEDGRPSAYMIRANDRIYLLTPVVRPSTVPLDDIAATFSAITPGPAPTSGPIASPAVPARSLAVAFASRNTDAIAQLMSPCVLAVSATIDGHSQGGVMNRAVGAFLTELQARFAAHDLSVGVDPQVQRPTSGNASNSFFLRSIWIADGRLTEIDLVFTLTSDGRWLWTQATPHFRGTDVRRGCLPYGRPWVPTSPAC